MGPTNLRSLMYEDFIPRVVVTNREFALINALYNVFSTSSHFFMQMAYIYIYIFLHIVRKQFDSKAKWKVFISTWNVLMLVEIGKTYEYYHSAFEGQNQMYTEATKY